MSSNNQMDCDMDKSDRVSDGLCSKIGAPKAIRRFIDLARVVLKPDG